MTKLWSKLCFLGEVRGAGQALCGKLGSLAYSTLIRRRRGVGDNAIIILWCLCGIFTNFKVVGRQGGERENLGGICFGFSAELNDIKIE